MKKSQKILCIITLALLTVTASANVQPIEYLWQATFSKSPIAEISPPEAKLFWQGNAKMVEEHFPVAGDKVLYLDQASYGKLSNHGLTHQEGCISFWYRPAGNSLAQSRTLLSCRWNFNSSYMVLSQGWWEGDGGGGKTYCIFNNAAGSSITPGDIAHSDKWNFYALSWKLLPERKMQLTFFMNGISYQRISSKPLPENAAMSSDLFLGSDWGTSLSAKRSANGYFSDLQIFRHALSTLELTNIYQQKATLAGLPSTPNEIDWMQETVPLPYREKRDANGTLLESRILFAEGRVIFNQQTEQMHTELDKLQSSGFNVIMPVVWSGRGTEYLSHQFPASPACKQRMKKNPQYDHYKEFIRAAHEREVEVHSAFAVMRSGGKNPAWPQYQLGKESIWSNCYDPNFRRDMVKLILDHVDHYQVDGINLDFIRAVGGLNTPLAQQEYQRLYGRNFDEDRGDVRKMNEFTSRCIAEIVYNTRLQLQKTHPSVILSVAGTPQLKWQGLLQKGRNTAIWLDNGWVDFVFCMDYGKRLGIEFFDQARAESKNPYGWVMGLGNYDWQEGICISRDGQLFAKLVDYCRRKYNDGNGFAAYFWSKLDDAQISALRKDPLKEIAKAAWRRPVFQKNLAEIFPTLTDNDE